MKAMKLLRAFGSVLAVTLAAAAFAGDPSGTWKWTVQSPNGEVATTLKLDAQDGKLTGAYSNQFGDASISQASFKDDVIAFEVVRDFDGNKFVLKYRGKLEGDTIKGTIEVPGMDGGEGMKLDWKAARIPQKPAEPKAKS